MLNYEFDIEALMNEYAAIRVPADERKQIRELLENPPEDCNPVAMLRDAAQKQAERYPRFNRILRILEG